MIYNLIYNLMVPVDNLKRIIARYATMSIAFLLILISKHRRNIFLVILLQIIYWFLFDESSMSAFLRSIQFRKVSKLLLFFQFLIIRTILIEILFVVWLRITVLFLLFLILKRLSIPNISQILQMRLNMVFFLLLNVYSRSNC